ncbi:E3 ubiquitin-protein ligase ubr1, partial [Blomia tropicalis]
MDDQTINFDQLQEVLLCRAKEPLGGPSENSIVDLILAHWSVEVPNIFRPTSVNRFKQYDETAAVERLLAPLEWFITGTSNAKELLAKLKDVCPAPELCGKVFRGGEPIYNCRDCALDGTCVLCLECFKNGEHKNHRYRICQSSSGYCDCGDAEAWKAHPNCSLHAKTVNNDAFISMLGNIMSSIEFEQLLFRLRLIFKFVLDYCYVMLKWPESELPNFAKSKQNTQAKSSLKSYVSLLYNDEIHTYEHVIFALTKSIRCDNKGATEFASAVDREGRTIILLDESERCEAVANQIGDITKKNSEKKLEVKVVHVDVYAHQTFATRLMTWMSSILPICEQFRTIFASHIFATNHQTEMFSFNEDEMDRSVSLMEKLFLSDTFFWKSVRIQWHQLFMSGLLLDLETKKQFARLFTRNYPAIIADYMRDDHEHRVSILCLSVQIYTVPSIAVMLLEHENIIQLFLDTFLDINQDFHIGAGRFKFDTINHPSAMYLFRRSYHLLSDLSYIISRPPDEWNDKLRDSFCIGIESFVKLIKRMQLMDSVVRQVNQHIEYEPGWETGINFQGKIAPLMTYLAHWCGTDQQVYVRTLNSALKWFRYSFNSANHDTKQVLQHAAGHSAFCWNYDVSRKEISIHMPLIRFIAALMIHMNKFQINYEDDKIIKERLTIDTLIELPLRTQVMVGQFRAGMWRRNGYSLVNQVMFYFNNRFRDEMYNRDVTMLQIGAALLDPNEFLIHLLNKFGLMFLLDDQCQRPTNDELIRQTNTVIEEFFRLIYVIVVERYQPELGDVTEGDVIKRETIQWLCMDSMSNSDLLSHLSVEESYLNVEEYILEVARFVKPNNPVKHGKYELKEEFYKDFNPFFYHYSRHDQSEAMEAQLRRRKQKKEQYICCPPPMLPNFVPYFQSINNILLSDVMFALIKTILEKTCDLNDNLFSDTQFQQVLYICGVALQEELKHCSGGGGSNQFAFSAKCVDNGICQLLERCNSRHIVPRIETHVDLLQWLFAKFKEVFLIRSDSTASSSSSLSASFSSSVSNDHVMADHSTNATTATAESLENQRKEEENLRAERRAIAERRKRMILEQMNAKQKLFMKKNAEMYQEEEEENVASERMNTNRSNSGSLMDISSIPPVVNNGIAIGVRQDNRTNCTTSFESNSFTCILCLEHHDINSVNRFLLLGAFIQESTVLSQNRNHKTWLYSSNKDSTPHDNRYSNEMLKNVCFVDSDLNYGPHINTCTHYMHNDCFEKYFEMVIQHERRRNNRHPRLSFNVNKREFLCPLCECLCNITIPIVPQVNVKNESLKFDMPMDKYLIGLHSIISDSGCDGFSGWIDSHKYIETYPFFQKTCSELLQFLPSDIREAFQAIQKEYQENLQLDGIATGEVLPSKISTRKKLFYSCTENVFLKIFGSSHKTSFSGDSPDPLQCIYWSIAYTIQTFERQIRSEKTSLGELIDTRPYQCLRALVALVRSQHSVYSYTVPRKLFLYLSNYLLIQTFYSTSPYNILDLDSFSLLVTLLCTSGSLFVDDDNTHLSKKFAVLLGNSTDKNLIQFILTLHLVQIILTNSTNLCEPQSQSQSSCSNSVPMDVDQSTSTPTVVTDHILVRFTNDVLISAGHRFDASLLQANGSQVTSNIRNKLLPFLRCCTIFSHFLTDIKLPKRILEMSPINTEKSAQLQWEEYDLLCRYVGLECNFSFLEISQLRSVALFWPRHFRVKEIFETKRNDGNSVQTVLKPDCLYLTQPHRLNRLFQLPHDYTDFLNSTAKFTCPNSNGEESRFPTMCLICGEVLCSQYYCCQKKLKREMVGACAYHAIICGAGTGLFLRARDCKILLLSTHGRGCYLPSPYVDKYGETDQGLLRGCPLFLSQSALDNLYKLWLRHGIPEQIVHRLESSS